MTQVPSELKRALVLFRNLKSDKQVLAAFAAAGVVIVGKPPARQPSDPTPTDRESFKRAWGLKTDDELDEAIALQGLVMVSLGDLAEAARTAKHPLIVAKAIVGASGGLESKLSEVVGILRERGCSWTQIGAALGITKQSAWERFSGED